MRTRLPAGSYLVCATARSGSTLLCELLTLTGVAGHPNEWLIRTAEPLARGVFGMNASFDDPSYLAELIAKAATPNGVFAAKLMWPRMQELLEGSSPWFDFGFSRPPRCVHIIRSDELKQAVSFLLSSRTNQWQRITRERNGAPSANWIRGTDQLDSATRNYFLSGDEVPRWSVEEIEAELRDPVRRSTIIAEIDAHLRMIREHNHAWVDFFAREKLEVFTVRYETLVAGPEPVIKNVLEFLGLEADPGSPSLHPRLAPLRDARNALLERAYHDASRRSINPPL